MEWRQVSVAVFGEAPPLSPAGTGGTAVPETACIATRAFTRPPSERLITRKLDLRGLNIMRDWRVCLDEYLADAYAGYLESAG